MPANAGIQQGLGQSLDSRLRGNDDTAGCASVGKRVGLAAKLKAPGRKSRRAPTK
jgi:hypothetical protein